MLVQCERWNPGYNSDAWHQGGMLKRLLGQRVVNVRGSLELSTRGSLVVGTSDWLVESDNCGAPVGVSRMDMSHVHSLVWVAREASEGEAIVAEDMMMELLAEPLL